jgi:hypothetical protein
MMGADPTASQAFAVALSGGSAAFVAPSAEPPDAGRVVATPSSTSPPRSLVIAMIGDNSGSTATALVPRPTRTQIAELLNLVAVCIDSRQAMLRVYFEAPPAQRPRPRCRLTLREEVVEEAEKVRRQDAEASRDWDVRTHEQMDSFLSIVADQVVIEHSCQRSDVWGALQRVGGRRSH